MTIQVTVDAEPFRAKLRYDGEDFETSGRTADHAYRKMVRIVEFHLSAMFTVWTRPLWGIDVMPRITDKDGCSYWSDPWGNIHEWHKEQGSPT